MGKRSAPYVAPVCIECGSLAVQSCGAVVYPHRPDLRDKPFYLCQCGASVGCHPNTTRPLGLPAGPETKRWRAAAHGAFDPIWKAKSGAGVREKAYKWLRQELGLSRDACHISHMDAATCRRVIELCRPITDRLKARAAGSGPDDRATHAGRRTTK